MKKMILSAIVAFVGLTPLFAQADECRQSGSSVCAISSSTGQCHREWRFGRDENPMYQCMRYLGKIENRVDRTTHTCRKSGDSVCAVHPRTNQCTQEWSKKKDGDPMFHCQRYIGKGPAPIDHTGYVCRSNGAGVCAIHPKTKQCTRSWTEKEYGNGAMARCLRHIRN